MEMESVVRTRGDRRNKIRTYITKAQEEIRPSTLRTLSQDNIGLPFLHTVNYQRESNRSFSCHRPDYVREQILDIRYQKRGKQPSPRKENAGSAILTQLDKRIKRGQKRPIASSDAKRDWRNLSAPRLINSMQQLDLSSRFVQMQHSTSSSSACSTLDGSNGESETRNYKIDQNKKRNSDYVFLTNNSSSSSSGVNRFQSVRNLRTNGPSLPISITSTSLQSSVSAYDLDLTNSDSVIRWTSQILAELDSIPDCSSEVTESEIRRKKRDSFDMPTEARQKLEEACAELRDLNVQRVSSANIYPYSTSTQNQLATQESSFVLSNDKGSAIRNGLSINDERMMRNGARKANCEMEEKRTRAKRNSSRTNVNGNKAITEPVPRQQTTNGMNKLSAGTSRDEQVYDEYRNRRKTTAAEHTTTKNISWLDGQTRNDSYHRNHPLRTLKSSVGVKSVRVVVDSLIKQVETHLGSRSSVMADRNNSIMENVEVGAWTRSDDYVELNDACTQTTPISLSRSSSFTWLPECGQLDQQNGQFGFYPTDRRVAEESPTDVSGGSGMDDEGRSLTPMTEHADGDGAVGGVLDKSLSLSGISHSSSSSTDLNVYGKRGKSDSNQKQRSSNERTIDNAISGEVWHTNDTGSVDSALGGPLPPESIPLMSTAAKSDQHSLISIQRQKKSDNLTAGVRLSAAKRELQRLPISLLQNKQASFRPGEKSGHKMEHMQRHVHVPCETRKCVELHYSASENETELEESVYDNVPYSETANGNDLACDGFLAKRAAVASYSPLFRRNSRVSGSSYSPNDNSLIGNAAESNMQKDISITSGLLADNESSPIYGEKGFVFLDGLRSDLTTPDSVKSLSNSEAGAALQAAPEFQYKSARDYMMDREAENLATASGCSTRTTHKTIQTLDMDFVPKESLLRGETMQVFSQPTNATSATTLSSESTSGHQTTAESGSKLSLTIPLETRAALANSLPALDRLDCPMFAKVGTRPMTTSTIEDDTAELNGINSGNLVGMDSEKTREDSNVKFSSRMENAETEARQCCFWLRATGFPQYAKMYEDGQFPIDVEAARKDHEFLDADSLQALFRRLHILNQCALIKLGCGQVQRRGTFALKTNNESDEEEDEIALSRKWRFVRKSRTWSRIVNELGTSTSPGQYQLTSTDCSLSPPSQPTTIRSADEDNIETMDPRDDVKRLSGATSTKFPDLKMGIEEAEPTSTTSIMKLRHSSFRQKDIDPTLATDDQSTQEQKQQRLRRSQSERLRDKAKALVRRMEMMANGRLRRRSPSLKRSIAEPEISGPVLIQHFSASPAHMRMFQDTCVPSTKNVTYVDSSVIIPSTSRISRTVPLERQPMSSRKVKVDSDERRKGRVFPMEPEVQIRESNIGSVEDRLSQDSEKCLNKLAGMDAHGVQRTKLWSAGPKRQLSARPRQEINGKNQCTESDSSPEIQAKSGCSSLRVQVDVDVRSTTLPPVSQSSFESSDADHSPQCWERRDSGVGSSLSRSPSVPTRPRVRWHSFQRRHGASGIPIRPDEPCSSIDHLLAPQVIAVQKYALLKLTALMEKYNPAHKSYGWSWGVQKLLRRMKATESKFDKDRQVFGVPLYVVAQRSGQALPQCILHAMRYLRKHAVDNVGLFRKSGVRSRIQKLHQICETSAELPVFESQQAYDVADMVKQYFRELPEPLLTSKLSETFIAIYLSVPEYLRMETVQKLILLLPDENREVLQSLLYFLYDVASHSAKNQMTAQNLAVCFAPTLFDLSARNAALSPTRRHKTITTTSGLPSEKELMENRAAQICLATMITNCSKLFSVPQDILMKCAHTMGDLHEPANLSELGHPYGNYSTYLSGCAEALMKEHRERWRGWVTEGCIDGVEITSKKATDEYPLKLWRCWVDVEAPPRELLHRILRERDAWDDDIIKWRVVQKLSDNCEVFQFVVNDMPPHPTRDYCVVRFWQSDIHDLRGGCVLVQTSVDLPEAPMLGGVRGVCLASRYLIEPSGGGKSRITQVDRIDTRGRSKNWYNKVFGYLIAMQLARLRDSFKQMADGPETKV